MDVFSLLKSGIAFDKKKFKSDIDVFETSSNLTNNLNSSDPKKKSKTSNDENSQQQEIVLSDQLDFFNVQQKSVSKSLSTGTGVTHRDNDKQNHLKSIKKQQEQDSDKDSDSDDEVKNNNKSSSSHKDAQTKSDHEIRKLHKIKVYGTDVPRPIQCFKELFSSKNGVGHDFQFASYLEKNLETNHYETPTPIQMQSIPLILKGRDVIACAPTGSGKTLAFTLPILDHLKTPEKSLGFRAVIITPTRELALQIHREMSQLCTGRKFKICVLSKRGNANNENDMAQYKNFDILITTPLRLVHALKTDAICLNNVKHLVFDEADRLLDLGFLEQVDEILSSCTNPRLQKTLFSATISSGVEELADSFMMDSVRVVIGTKNAATETIDQELLFVGSEEGKMVAMRQLIQKGGMKPPVLIFVQSIDRAKQLFHELVYDNINVDVMHSERTKAQRDNIVYQFRVGKIWVLIATELMARGIDFKGVNLVINYDFPQSVASYIHRIGRTGRAGMTGKAITFFTKDDAPYLKSIVTVMRESGCSVPEWMLELKKPSKELKKNLKRQAIKRKHIKVVSKYDADKMNHKKQIIENNRKKRKEREQN